jgi:hypothetical protein
MPPVARRPSFIVRDCPARRHVDPTNLGAVQPFDRRSQVARKPNYDFERNARAKAKTAKREAKRQAKAAARAKKAGATSTESTADDSSVPTDASAGGNEDRPSSPPASP